MEEEDIKDLIPFIAEGKQVIKASEKQSNTLKRKDNIVLVVGTTGAGKSTLVNYLNSVELKCILRDGKWKIDLVDENKGLPGGFSIGHKVSTSETIYPGVYSPNEENFSYIDCPGFGESRGIKIEIANLFFREYITQQAKQIKILLVVSYNNLTSPEGRGQNLYDCLKDLSNFLGIFNDERHLSKLKESIGLVITGVTDHAKAQLKNLTKEIEEKNTKLISCSKKMLKIASKIKDEQQKINSPQTEKKISKLNKEQSKVKTKQIELQKSIEKSNLELDTLKDEKPIQEIIKKILRDFIDARSLTDSEKQVLLHIVDNNRLKIFSNPEKSVVVDLAEKDQIVEFIKEDIKFLDKELAKFSIITPQKHVGDLLQYTQSQFEEIKGIIQNYLTNDVNSFLAKVINAAVDEESIVEARKCLNKLCHNGREVKSLTNFIHDLDNQIFKSEYKKQLYENCAVIEFLINLLPAEYKTNFGYNQKYLEKLELVSNLQGWNQVLDKFCTKPEFIYENGVVTCQGYFIKISDIEVKVNQYNDSSRLQYLKIHALNSITFDESLISKKLSRCNVVMLAPKWNITKSSITINLSGLDQTNYPEGTDKASNGSELSVDGRNGLPGLNGFNSGDFFGIGKEFFGENELKITTNGGKGGTGQAGGNGIEGKKGAAAKVSEVKRHSDFFMTREQKGIGIDEYYFKEGESGTTGGNAGRGGLGGKGGEAGKVYWGIVKDPVGPQVKIAVESKVGEEGKIGNHGLVGKGGLYGDTAVRIYYNKNEFRANLEDGKLPTIFGGWKGSHPPSSSTKRAIGGIVPEAKDADLKQNIEQVADHNNENAINARQEIILYKEFCEQAQQTIKKIVGIELIIADFEQTEQYEIKELGSNMDYAENHS